MPADVSGWKTDFFDDFDTFDPDNWQDQILWVNNGGLGDEYPEALMRSRPTGA